MSRGENNWLITIPKDGSIPIVEGAPALIQWQVESHPDEDHIFISCRYFIPNLEFKFPELYSSAR